MKAVVVKALVVLVKALVKALVVKALAEGLVGKAVCSPL